MRRSLISLITFITACGQVNDNPSAERARLALTRMPTCISASDAGDLKVVWACTEVLCGDDACCNRCTLREVTVGTATIDLQRARDVLDLDAEVSNCDATAIRDVFQNVRMSFSDATCVWRH